MSKIKHGDEGYLAYTLIDQDVWQELWWNYLQEVRCTEEVCGIFGDQAELLSFGEFLSEWFSEASLYDRLLKESEEWQRILEEDEDEDDPDNPFGDGDSVDRTSASSEGGTPNSSEDSSSNSSEDVEMLPAEQGVVGDSVCVEHFF